MEFPRQILQEPTPLFWLAVGVGFRKGKTLITRRKTKGLLCTHVSGRVTLSGPVTGLCGLKGPVG